MGAEEFFSIFVLALNPRTDAGSHRVLARLKCCERFVLLLLFLTFSVLFPNSKIYVLSAIQTVVNLAFMIC